MIKQHAIRGLRGLFYITFYILRNKPKIFIAKIINPVQRITIAIGKIKYDMLVDLNDNGISQDLYSARVREYPNVLFFIKFLTKYGKSIDTVFEIGANIGYYFLLSHVVFKNKLKKNVKIIGVEPVSDNFAILKKNAELHEINNSILIKAAVGDRDKKINVIVPREKNLSHLEGIDNVSSIKEFSTEKVDMYSLRTLFDKYSIKRKRVLFRWDIEGYEYQIMTGNKDIFRELRNAFIIMEFHPQLLKKRKTVQFLKVVKDLGFELEYAVSCYPLYFFTGVPRFMTRFLNKLWVLEKGGDSLGFLSKFASIDELIKEFSNENSPLYSHPNLHLYLVKNA